MAVLTGAEIAQPADQRGVKIKIQVSTHPEKTFSVSRIDRLSGFQRKCPRDSRQIY
jgi:hypothetical protein